MCCMQRACRVLAIEGVDMLRRLNIGSLGASWRRPRGGARHDTKHTTRAAVSSPHPSISCFSASHSSRALLVSQRLLRLPPHSTHSILRTHLDCQRARLSRRLSQRVSRRRTRRAHLLPHATCHQHPRHVSQPPHLQVTAPGHRPPLPLLVRGRPTGLQGRRQRPEAPLRRGRYPRLRPVLLVAILECLQLSRRRLLPHLSPGCAPSPPLQPRQRRQPDPSPRPPPLQPPSLARLPVVRRARRRDQPDGAGAQLPACVGAYYRRGV